MSTKCDDVCFQVIKMMLCEKDLSGVTDEKLDDLLKNHKFYRSTDIDKLESDRDKLLEACIYTRDLLSKGIGQSTHALAIIEAAIAKREKGSE